VNFASSSQSGNAGLNELSQFIYCPDGISAHLGDRKAVIIEYVCQSLFHFFH
jgi:hypothetical protein